MIEAILQEYLSSKLSAPVLTEKPKNPTVPYYLIEKTGGSVKNHIERSTVTIQSYGDSLYNAALQNKLLKEQMIGPEGIILLDEIVSVDLNSDYNYTDGKEKSYRYQALFDICHY